MPRGMPAGTDKWTFHVPRFKCPYCDRKGLIMQWYSDTGLTLTCMHRKGYKKDCQSPFLIGDNIQYKFDKSKSWIDGINAWLKTYIK